MANNILEKAVITENSSQSNKNNSSTPLVELPEESILENDVVEQDLGNENLDEQNLEVEQTSTEEILQLIEEDKGRRIQSTKVLGARAIQAIGEVSDEDVIGNYARRAKYDTKPQAFGLQSKRTREAFTVESDGLRYRNSKEMAQDIQKKVARKSSNPLSKKLSPIMSGDGFPVSIKDASSDKKRTDEKISEILSLTVANNTALVEELNALTNSPEVRAAALRVILNASQDSKNVFDIEGHRSRIATLSATIGMIQSRTIDNLLLKRLITIAQSEELSSSEKEEQVKESVKTYESQKQQYLQGVKNLLKAEKEAEKAANAFAITKFLKGLHPIDALKKYHPIDALKEYHPIDALREYHPIDAIKAKFSKAKKEKTLESEESIETSHISENEEASQAGFDSEVEIDSNSQDIVEERTPSIASINTIDSIAEDAQSIIEEVELYEESIFSGEERRLAEYKVLQLSSDILKDLTVSLTKGLSIYRHGLADVADVSKGNVITKAGLPVFKLGHKHLIETLYSDNLNALESFEYLHQIVRAVKGKDGTSWDVNIKRNPTVGQESYEANVLGNSIKNVSNLAKTIPSISASLASVTSFVAERIASSITAPFNKNKDHKTLSKQWDSMFPNLPEYKALKEIALKVSSDKRFNSIIKTVCASTSPAILATAPISVPVLLAISALVVKTKINTDKESSARANAVSEIIREACGSKPVNTPEEFVTLYANELAKSTEAMSEKQAWFLFAKLAQESYTEKYAENSEEKLTLLKSKIKAIDDKILNGMVYSNGALNKQCRYHLEKILNDSGTMDYCSKLFDKEYDLFSLSLTLELVHKLRVQDMKTAGDFSSYYPIDSISIDDIGTMSYSERLELLLKLTSLLRCESSVMSVMCKEIMKLPKLHKSGILLEEWRLSAGLVGRNVPVYSVRIDALKEALDSSDLNRSWKLYEATVNNICAELSEFALESHGQKYYGVLEAIQELSCTSKLLESVRTSKENADIALEIAVKQAEITAEDAEEGKDTDTDSLDLVELSSSNLEEQNGIEEKSRISSLSDILDRTSGVKKSSIGCFDSIKKSVNKAPAIKKSDKEQSSVARI